jgi:hypothetical protein
MAMLWVCKSASLYISRIRHLSPERLLIEFERNLSFKTLPKSSSSSNFASNTYYPSPKLILSFIYPLLSFYIDFHILYDIPLSLRTVYDSSEDLCNPSHLSKRRLYSFSLHTRSFPFSGRSESLLFRVPFVSFRLYSSIYLFLRRSQIIFQM